MLTKEESTLISTAFVAGLGELQSRGNFEAVSYVGEQLNEAVHLEGMEFVEKFTHLMEYMYEQLKEEM